MKKKKWLIGAIAGVLLVICAVTLVLVLPKKSSKDGDYDLKVKANNCSVLANLTSHGDAYNKETEKTDPNGTPSTYRDLLIGGDGESNLEVTSGSKGLSLNDFYFAKKSGSEEFEKITLSFKVENNSKYKTVAKVKSAKIEGVETVISEEETEGIILDLYEQHKFSITYTLTDLTSKYAQDENKAKVPFKIEIELSKYIEDEDFSLSAPTNVALSSEDVLTFDKVKKATAYEVSYYNGTQLIKAYEIKESGLEIEHKPTTNGDYTVKIRAVAYTTNKEIYSSYVTAGTTTVAVCEHLKFTALDSSKKATTGDAVYYGVAGMGDCTHSHVIVPATYNGLPVVSIMDKAFKDSTMKHISLPNTITSIKKDGFKYCRKLISIEFPQGLTSVADGAFYYCTSLKNVIIPESLSYFGTECFFGSRQVENVYIKNIDKWVEIGFSNPTASPVGGNNLILNGRVVEHVVLSEGVKKIKNYAFYNVKTLKTIQIPEGVTAIGSYAFNNCQALKIINIPESLVSTATYSFSQSNEIREVHIKSVSKWAGINFGGDGSAPIFSKTKLYENGKLVEDAVISGIEKIGSSAFNNYKFLKSVDIKEGVTEIGASAFSSCSSLVSVNIPKSITKIANQAFAICPNLERVNITDINKWASIDFGIYSSSNPLNGQKSNLYLNGELVENVELSNEVTKLYYYTFYNCKSLKSIKLPSTLTNIGGYSFQKCTQLKNIIIPEGVDVIGSKAFADCTSLEWVLMPSTITRIIDDTFENANEDVIVFYNGSSEKFYETVDFYGVDNVSERTYFYLPNIVPTGGQYWRYVDGVPTVWEIAGIYVKFVSHDCSVQVDGFVQGDACLDGIPDQSGQPSSKRNLIIDKTNNDNRLDVVSGETVVNVGLVYFAESAGDITTITFTFNIKNTSDFSINASIINDGTGLENIETNASQDLTIEAGETKTLTATLNVKDANVPVSITYYDILLNFSKAV